MMLGLLIVTLLFAGFFSGVEIAFLSVNKLGIELKKKQGKSSGFILSNFLENPSKFIGATLIGFNIFFVIYGLIISDMLEPLWKWAQIKQLDSSDTLKLIINILFSCGILLVVLFVFKAIFRARNDGALSVFAGLINFFYNLFSPLVSFFVTIAGWVLKYIFNVTLSDSKTPLYKSDLEHYYQQNKDAGEDTNELNQELFENALSLAGVKVRNCLVPRKEIIAVELSTTIAEVVAKLVDTKLTRMVVYEGTIDNIVGYIHQLDLFKNAASIQSILLPIPAVPETMSVTDLIAKFSKERKSIAWVVDEFGGTAGIITMEDLLEEIFGEIKDEYDTEELVDKQLAENEFMFSGRMELDTISEKYGLEFEKENTDTLSGYIIQQNENLPRQGDRIITGNYQFDIINMSDTRIELAKMKVLK